MVDIVKELKDIAETLNYKFDYGTRAMLNLIKSKDTDDDIYFMLSAPITWSNEASEYGIGNSTASGNFLLLKRSKFGGVVYRSKNQDEDKTKYNKNIVPLFTEVDNIKSALLCGTLQIKAWSAVEGYDIFDGNFDGLIITFSLYQR